MSDKLVEDISKELTPFSANPLIVVQCRLKRHLPNGDVIESLSKESKRVWIRLNNNLQYPRPNNSIINRLDASVMGRLNPYKPK